MTEINRHGIQSSSIHERSDEIEPDEGFPIKPLRISDMSDMEISFTVEEGGFPIRENTRQATDEDIVRINKNLDQLIKDKKAAQQEFVKHDEGKPRYDLIPGDALEEVAKCFTHGAKKYPDNNWSKGAKWSRYFSAMMRHAWAFWRGEKYDKDSGQHHLASVVACAMILMSHDMRSLGEDDRLIDPNI